jgi:hypothetical protein
MNGDFETKEFEQYAIRLMRYLATTGTAAQKMGDLHTEVLDLLKQYLIVKTKLGRIPLEPEAAGRKKISRKSYREYFGSYENFLSIIGEKKEPAETARSSTSAPVEEKDQIKPPTVIELIYEYRRVYLLLQKLPTLKDLNEHSVFSAQDYKATFKNFNQLARYVANSAGIQSLGKR